MRPYQCPECSASGAHNFDIVGNVIVCSICEHEDEG